MGVPSIPLSDLYNRAIDYLQSRGGRVDFKFRTGIICVGWRNAAMDKWPHRARASPPMPSSWRWRLKGLSKLLPGFCRETSRPISLALNLECFEHSPITGIHLWFDREVSDLEHAISARRNHTMDVSQVKIATGKSDGVSLGVISS